VNLEARLFTVHGRVQGVWFRDSTRREAERLAISGHAINLPNGNVEVLAVGSARALEELAKWLHVGPPMSRVLKVESRDIEVPDITGFRTG
jgi:acylphosphatase